MTCENLVLSRSLETDKTYNNNCLGLYASIMIRYLMNACLFVGSYLNLWLLVSCLGHGDVRFGALWYWYFEIIP